MPRPRAGFELDPDDRPTRAEAERDEQHRPPVDPARLPTGVPVDPWQAAGITALVTFPEDDEAPF